MAKKMTKEEFYNEILKGNVTEEMYEIAEKELELIVKGREKERQKRFESAAEDIPVILDVMGEDFMTANEIREKLILKGFDFSTQKIGHRLRIAKESNLVELDYKVSNGSAKRVYRLLEI